MRGRVSVEERVHTPASRRLRAGGRKGTHGRLRVAEVWGPRVRKGQGWTGKWGAAALTKGMTDSSEAQ